MGNFSSHINDDVTTIENNLQVSVNVHTEVFAISCIVQLDYDQDFSTNRMFSLSTFKMKCKLQLSEQANSENCGYPLLGSNCLGCNHNGLGLPIIVLSVKWIFFQFQVFRYVGQRSRFRSHRSKILVWVEMPHHKEWTTDRRMDEFRESGGQQVYLWSIV